MSTEPLQPVHPEITADLPGENTPPAAPAVKKNQYGLIRRVLRALFWSTLLTFSALALVLFSALSWFNSDSGRFWLVDAINRTGVASIQSIDGSFWSELQIKQLKVQTDSVNLALDYGVLRWEPYLLMLRDLSLPLVSLGQLELSTPPSPPDSPPTEPPASLSLPFGVHLETLKIAKLKINGAEFNDIAGSISSNGRFHRLHLNQLRLPQGNVAAALNITGKAPFVSAGSFIFAGQLEGQAIQAVGQVEGPLRELQIDATIEHAKLKGRAKLQADVFAPYAYQMVRHGQVNVQGLNPQLWYAAAPKALLNIDADFTPTKTGIDGQIKLSNQMPGAIDLQKLPITGMQLQFLLQEQRLKVAQWQVQFGSKSQLHAQGVVEQGQLQLDLSAEHLDPKLFWSPQPFGDMSGKIALNGPWLSPAIKGEITDLQRKANLKLDLAWINPKKERRLAIRDAQLSRANSQISAKGEINLLGKNDFKADAVLKNVDPSEFAGVPRGSISGEVNLKGLLRPKPIVDIQYALNQSQFNGQPLAGEGRLKLDQQRISQSDLWLTLGSNKLTADGRLGGVGDSLNLVLHMPNLSLLGPQFQGQLVANATLTGELSQPRINGHMELEHLITPFDLKVQHAQVSASMSSDLNGPLAIDANLQKLSLASTLLDSFSFQVKGSMQQHDLQLKTKGLQGNIPLLLELQAKGGLNARQIWNGQILAMTGQAGLPFKVLNSPQVKLGANEVELAATGVSLGQSQIQLMATHWAPGSLETQGQIRSLAVSEWLALANISNPSSDLILAGDWNLKQTAVLNGAFNLGRVAGDLRWKDETHKVLALALNKLSLAGQINMNQVAVQSHIVSEQFGRLSFSGDSIVDLESGGLAVNAPINAAIKGSLPNLAVFSPFLGSNVKLTGNAEIDVRRQGPLKSPQFSGGIRIAELGYSDSNTGVKIQQGAVDIALSNQKISLQSFHAKGTSNGDLTGSGALDFSNGKANGSFNIAANHFTLVSKPDMLLVMTGQGAMVFKDNDLAVTGNFKADSGDIQFQASDVPRLSNDVIVIGREKVAAKPLTMKLQLQLDVDLGQNFMFRGYGLESRLVGRLRLKGSPNMQLTATGTIYTEEGEYKAYGQKLDIERGILSFQGVIDNPSLDILAIRRNQAVEAGVEVRGTAYSPRVTLYSEPSVPDSEKISWLLFGHGSDSMEKSDGALALQLLNAMAGDGGQGISDEILGNFGIDEVGYKSKEELDGSTTQVVTVSKRLTKTLRVALEKSFNGLSDAVNFTLQLSRNWSVVSRIGVDESSLDVKYTLNFD